MTDVLVDVMLITIILLPSFYSMAMNALKYHILLYELTEDEFERNFLHKLWTPIRKIVVWDLKLWKFFQKSSVSMREMRRRYNIQTIVPIFVCLVSGLYSLPRAIQNADGFRAIRDLTIIVLVTLAIRLTWQFGRAANSGHK